MSVTSSALPASVAAEGDPYLDEDLAMLCRLAYYALTYGKPMRAVDYLNAAMQIDAEHPQVLRLQAVTYVDAGAPQHALQTLETLEQKHGDAMSSTDRAAFLLIKSRALHGTGNLDAARACFKEYVQARSVDPAASDALNGT